MTPREIPKAYDPKSIESFWVEFWVEKGLFKPSGDPKQPPFTIVIPPPNVTGSLHMGHALNNTLQDVLIRWKKMQGFDTLWVPGTDHGGIATQNVVEKLLKQEKQSRHDLGREKFLERMWQWRRESGDTILMQLRRLGSSLDWSRTRFTMDEVCSKAVQHSFMELYKKGWIYRGKRMVNWCVRCHTALSDIEVEHEERKDKLYYLRYPILNPDGTPNGLVIVATTRPETMLGDTAVAVHPEDSRYTHLKDVVIDLPLVGRKIPLIRDAIVDPKFGTGAVKVTPAHDPADFEMGERHKLPHEVVIAFDGKMTSAAGKFAGTSRDDCRKRVIEELDALGLVEKIEDYHHAVGCCYRCGTVVEPLMSDQWFLKTDTMAKEGARVVRDGLVKIFPESWTGPYLNWMDNLRDWCISRQIWWGHRIPVWYCKDCDAGEIPQIGHGVGSVGEGAHLPDANMRVIEGFAFGGDATPIVNETSPGQEPAQCPQCHKHNLVQDPDVLDTWFSSALWPFSVFGWPEKSKELEKFYPTSVLVTGHEILYLWVARMIMSGMTFDPKGAGNDAGKIPFSRVFIHGIVRDKHGKKMSKSLGNVIDPLTMMEKYGTDALRFVLTSQSVPGRDMQISDDTFVGARNFSNKIWNVSRYLMMSIDQAREQGVVLKRDGTALPPADTLELADRWILSRFQKTAEKVNQSLEEYNLAQASRALYQFVWSEFCDWYVELSKIRLLGNAPVKDKETALRVLETILDGTLRLLHPIMPFITEELWKRLEENMGVEKVPESLLLVSYPKPDPSRVSDAAESEMGKVMVLITAVRTIRSEMNVPPGRPIALSLNVSDDSLRALMEKYGAYLRHLCKIEDLKIGSALPKPPKSVSVVVEGMEAFIPLEGLIDFEKEKQRLDKEFGAVKNEIERIDARLANPDFVSHAPEEEVQKARQRKEESREKLGRLEEHLKSIQ